MTEKMSDKLMTSEEWSKEYILAEIIDPDGWDRSNFQYSWYEEKISFKEFEQRAMRSTCMWR